MDLRIISILYWDQRGNIKLDEARSDRIQIRRVRQGVTNVTQSVRRIYFQKSSPRRESRHNNTRCNNQKYPLCWWHGNHSRHNTRPTATNSTVSATNMALKWSFIKLNIWCSQNPPSHLKICCWIMNRFKKFLNTNTLALRLAIPWNVSRLIEILISNFAWESSLLHLFHPIVWYGKLDVKSKFYPGTRGFWNVNIPSGAQNIMGNQNNQHRSSKNKGERSRTSGLHKNPENGVF